MNLIWEAVESGMNRAPVPGGWIVQQYDQRYNEKMERWDCLMVGAFFVPDETHAWDITANTTTRPASAPSGNETETNGKRNGNDTEGD